MSIVLTNNPKIPKPQLQKAATIVKLIYDFLGIKCDIIVEFLEKVDKDFRGETEIEPFMPEVRIAFSRCVTDGLNNKSFKSPAFLDAIVTVVHEFIHASFKRSIAAVDVFSDLGDDKRVFSEMWTFIMEEETEVLAKGIAGSIADIMVEGQDEVEQEMHGEGEDAAAPNPPTKKTIGY